MESASLSGELESNINLQSSLVNANLTSQGLACEQTQSIEDAGKQAVTITVSGESL